MSKRTYSAEQLIGACAKAGIHAVAVGRYSTFNALRNVIVTDQIQVAEWCGNWERQYREPPDITKEASYEGCTDVTVTIASMTATVTMWNGDNFDGRSTTQRCRWVVQLIAEQFLQLFSEAVLANISYAANRTYDCRAEAARRRKIRAIQDAYFD